MNQNRLAMIKEMLASNPTDPFLKYAAALEFKKSREADEAIRLMEELVRENPDYLATYYQLGKLYEEKGQVSLAIKYYQAGKIIAGKQNDRKTSNELSEALMHLDAEDF